MYSEGDNSSEPNSWSSPVGSFGPTEWGSPRLLAERRVYRLYTVVRSGRRYVLKALRPELTGAEAYRALLHKEFQLANTLDHQGIAGVFALEKNPELGECIVMEYVDGSTLSDFLKTKPTKDERRRIAVELAEALCYLHSRGVYHRDLKPDNLMITNHGHHLRIIDFGLGDSDDFEMLKASGGTERYGAPEQQSPAGAVADAPADVWAYGSILRQLSCGLPYHRIAASCLRKDPGKRPDMPKVLRQIKRNFRSNTATYLLIPAVLLVGIGMGYLIFDRDHPDSKSGKNTPTNAIPAKEDATSRTDTVIITNRQEGHSTTDNKDNPNTSLLQDRVDSLFIGATGKARAIILRHKNGVLAAQDSGFVELHNAMRALSSELNALSHDFAKDLRDAGLPEYRISELDNALYNKITDLKTETGI